MCKCFLVDEDAARRFGELKAELEQVGAPLADLDLQIASVVLTHGLTLVTHNRQYFQHAPALGTRKGCPYRGVL